MLYIVDYLRPESITLGNGFFRYVVRNLKKNLFLGTWKKESVTGGEAFFKAFDPKPENLAKLQKAGAAEMYTEMVDSGATLKMVRRLEANG